MCPRKLGHKLLPCSTLDHSLCHVVRTFKQIYWEACVARTWGLLVTANKELRPSANSLSVCLLEAEPLAHWSSIGGDFAPQEPWQCLVTFWLSQLGVEILLACKAAKHPIVHQKNPFRTKDYSAKIINSSKVRKPARVPLEFSDACSLVDWVRTTSWDAPGFLSLRKGVR